jgi:predicted TIM-barrel fold metal-dependent hydrolase
MAAKLTDLGEGRLTAMDEAGMDVAVLSLSAPGIERFEPLAATKIAKAANDELAGAIRKYPARFRGFAALSARDTDAAVVEFERCVKELGFVGWNTHSNFGDSYLDEKRYWPLLAKAEELAALSTSTLISLSSLSFAPTVSVWPVRRTDMGPRRRWP